jgi:hypothetical protein
VRLLKTVLISVSDNELYCNQYECCPFLYIGLWCQCKLYGMKRLNVENNGSMGSDVERCPECLVVQEPVQVNVEGITVQE